MKLHELLAVEGSLTNQANACRADLKNTFEKKVGRFGEKQVWFHSNEEGKEPVQESPPAKIETTILSELAWVTEFMTKAMDADLQIDVANTQAKADVVLEDGATLATNVPATALLALEKRIGEFIDLLKTIPTLDPARGFVPDTAHGAGIYQAGTIIKNRTKKTKETIVLYPATKEFPAQVQLIDADVSVGKIHEMEWSSLLTPAEKSDLLARAEEVGRAVRQARSRANNIDVDTSNRIGRVLLDYIVK